MKKLTLILGILLSAFLYGQEVTTLTIDKIDISNLNIGDKISINLNITNLEYKPSSFQLYIEYDNKVLEYVSTTNINEQIKKGWQENNNKNVYAAVCMDLSRKGFDLAKQELMCTLEFIYKGGESKLNWSTESVTEGGILKMGSTTFTDVGNNTMSVNLINGCVCEQ